jgi:hypothetical protein
MADVYSSVAFGPYNRIWDNTEVQDGMNLCFQKEKYAYIGSSLSLVLIPALMLHAPLSTTSTGGPMATNWDAS